MDKGIISMCVSCAQDGDRIVIERSGEKTKTLWTGLGNRSGLHSYADELCSKKWAKSGGDKFLKKLERLTAERPCTVVILQYRSITRDRGRWIPVSRLQVLK